MIFIMNVKIFVDCIVVFSFWCVFGWMVGILWLNGKVRFGFCIFGFFVLVVVFVLLLVLYDFKENIFECNVDVFWVYWFGMMVVGEDVFSQFIFGVQVSFLVGFVVGIFFMIVVVLIGFSWGYMCGFVGEVIGFIVNFFFVIFGLLFMIVIVVYLQNGGILMIIVVIVVMGWVWGVCVFCSQMQLLCGNDFVILVQFFGDS